jgi:TRAP-type C4-dicarboxylate transport system substrate-binding protein
MLVTFLALAVIVLGTSLSSFSEEVTVNMASMVGGPQQVSPGRPPHHMNSTQVYFAKRIAFHTADDPVILNIYDRGGNAYPPGNPGNWIDWAKTGQYNVQATSLPSFFFREVPELMFQSIPYLFSGMEHVRRYPGSDVAAQINSLIEQRYDVKLLGNFMMATDMSINSRDRFYTRLEDFRGSRINDFLSYWKDMWVNYMPAEFVDCGNSCARRGGLLGDAWKERGEEGPADVNMGLLQNNYSQELFLEYKYNNYAPYMYAIFYTFVMSEDVWNDLTAYQQKGITKAAKEAEFAAFTFAASGLREHYLLQQERGVNMRIQTHAERQAWKAELRPKVEAIYKGHVGPAADQILADIGALDDRPDQHMQSGDLAEDAVVMNLASLIEELGELDEFSHHMSYTHSRLQTLISKYANGEVTLLNMPEEEIEAAGLFAPFLYVSGASKGKVDAVDVPSFFYRAAPFPPFNISNGSYLVDVQSQPFVFENVEHFRRFLNSEAEAIITADIEVEFPGVKVLGYFTIGSDVAINSNVGPVRLPTDLCGHRVTPGMNRGALYMAACKAAGLEPITDLSGEFGTDEAFAGAHHEYKNEINVGMFQNGYGQALHRWPDETYISNYYSIFYTFAVNRDRWNNLTPSQQASFQRAVDETEMSAFAYQIHGLLQNQGHMQAKGVKVHYQTKAERAAWKEFLAPVLESWVANAPDPAKARTLLESIAALAHETDENPALPQAKGK